jgi:hypothetical protein
MKNPTVLCVCELGSEKEGFLERECVCVERERQDIRKLEKDMRVAIKY